MGEVGSGQAGYAPPAKPAERKGEEGRGGGGCLHIRCTSKASGAAPHNTREVFLHWLPARGRPLRLNGHTTAKASRTARERGGSQRLDVPCEQSQPLSPPTLSVRSLTLALASPDPRALLVRRKKNTTKGQTGSGMTRQDVLQACPPHDNLGRQLWPVETPVARKQGVRQPGRPAAKTVGQPSCTEPM